MATPTVAKSATKGEEEPSVLNLEAEALKEKGNEDFRSGHYEDALAHYMNAIEIDGSNAKYYVNKSLCHASLHQWQDSVAAAKTAVRLSPKLTKAHFRLIKAYTELGAFKEARLALLSAIRECGESKDLRALEGDLLQRTGVAVRPRPTDFEILAELGEGNFSKIFKASYKPTGIIYAVKTIEKMTVDRMRKRHPNINNEIQMEKRVLNKLQHPGVVTLYSTFQDYGTLYYQLEFVSGGDLWSLLQEAQILGANPAATGPVGGAGRDPFSQVTPETEMLSGCYEPRVMVGCPWSLARFYCAEALCALEYMHKRGIAHRDVKPENMMIGADGHLKFVDFGTAKDFVQPDLNGPEFVGTPEYMSPETVRSRCCGVGVDLWALGIVLFQMLFGYTPFNAASPYLIFLRIKRGYLRVPDWAPACVTSFLHLLLEPDPHLRVQHATGLSAEHLSPPTPSPSNTAILTQESTSSSSPAAAATKKKSHDKTGKTDKVNKATSASLAAATVAEYTYDALRGHPFFSDWGAAVAQQRTDPATIMAMVPPADSTTPPVPPITAPDSAKEDPPYPPSDTDNTTTTVVDAILETAESALSSVEGCRTVYQRPAPRIQRPGAGGAGKASERALRSLGRACVALAAAVAQNGGIRPKEPWMQAFDLQKLTALDRGQLQHYLARLQRLHSPGVLRLFHTSVVESRALRSDVAEKEFTPGGLTRSLQQHWDCEFHFLQLADLRFGYAGGRSGSSSNVGEGEGAEASLAAVTAEQSERLRGVVSSINKLRPRFVVVEGNLTASCFGETRHADLVEQVRRNLARLSDTIPAIYVPGFNDIADSSAGAAAPCPSPASIQAYRSKFGADYFGFWYGGLRGFVVNSSLMIYPQCAAEEAALQDTWLMEELEQAKLCSQAICIFTFHPWFLRELDEPDTLRADLTGAGAAAGAGAGDVYACFPRELRLKWMKKMRHNKIRLLVSSSAAGNMAISSAPSAACSQALGRQTEEAAVPTVVGLARVEPLRPFSNIKKSKKSKQLQAEAEAGAEAEAEDSDLDCGPPPFIEDEELPKPSEIISQAVSSGKLSVDDTCQATSAEAAEAECARAGDTDTGKEAEDAGGDADSVATDDLPSDSDRSSDYDDYVKSDAEEEEEFLNEHDDYEGPELLFSQPAIASASCTASSLTHVEGATAVPAGGGGASSGGFLRAVYVQEFDMSHREYDAQSIPKSLAELLQDLQQK